MNSKNRVGNMRPKPKRLVRDE